jgi:hypothetical protein
MASIMVELWDRGHPWDYLNDPNQIKELLLRNQRPNFHRLNTSPPPLKLSELVYSMWALKPSHRPNIEAVREKFGNQTYPLLVKFGRDHLSWEKVKWSSINDNFFVLQSTCDVCVSSNSSSSSPNTASEECDGGMEFYRSATSGKELIEMGKAIQEAKQAELMRLEAINNEVHNDEEDEDDDDDDEFAIEGEDLYSRRISRERMLSTRGDPTIALIENMNLDKDGEEGEEGEESSRVGKAPEEESLLVEGWNVTACHEKEREQALKVLSMRVTSREYSKNNNSSITQTQAQINLLKKQHHDLAFKLKQSTSTSKDHDHEGGGGGGIEPISEEEETLGSLVRQIDYYEKELKLLHVIESEERQGWFENSPWKLPCFPRRWQLAEMSQIDEKDKNNLFLKLLKPAKKAQFKFTKCAMELKVLFRPLCCFNININNIYMYIYLQLVLLFVLTYK